MVHVPIDLQVESQLETSITISNFTERYHAAKNGALDNDERTFNSITIPFAYQYGDDDTGPMIAEIELEVWVALVEDVSWVDFIQMHIYA